VPGHAGLTCTDGLTPCACHTPHATLILRRAGESRSDQGTEEGDGWQISAITTGTCLGMLSAGMDWRKKSGSTVSRRLTGNTRPMP
jgi:hypothetical protein